MVKTQTRFTVDMIVQMPKSIFQDKDYQNMRYFYRRAYYIAYIAAHIRKDLAAEMEFTFEYLNENRLLPVLVLRPKATSEKHNGKNFKKDAAQLGYFIRLIPCAPEALFSASKLVPSANSNKSGEADDKKSTPFYNSTLKAEGTFVSYLRVLTRAKNECAAFPHACILGRTWLQQRGFGSDISQGGFGHFEWAVMVALLLQTGGRNGTAALSTSLSGPEIFKAAIQFLNDTDFNKKAIMLGPNAGKDGIKEAGPVMYDPSTMLNLLFKMTLWSASLLQMHAKSTADLLADEAAEKFEPTFIVRTNILSQVYDAVFQIKSRDITKSASPDRRGAVWDFCSETYKVLKKAYGNRAQLVHIQKPPSKPWSLGASIPAEADTLLVGVIFDFTHMSRRLDKGPSAEEQKESAKFCQFWGDKSELRRFNDGNIVETIEWNGTLPFQICEEITQYILGRHLKLTKEEIKFYGRDFSSIVSFSHVDKLAFDSARKAFQTFERDVRNLEELPLQIRQLAPVSSAARYSSIYTPMIGAYKGSVEPIEVNMMFEASSKWPENLVAIQEAKIEFLLDIDRRLTTAHENITTYLGRENREVGTTNLTYLDVLYDNGAAFRVRIHTDLEEQLMERQAKNNTLEHYVRDEAQESLHKFRWHSDVLPLHTQTIATFSTRFFALSQTIRLVKQWFNSHKLSGHFSEELIELFVLHVFLTPYPWKTPSSVTTGFLRTLDFLSRWDWRDEPLIVDSAEKLSREERSSISRALEEWRKRDPNLNHTTLIVATSHDQSGLAYTRNSPSKLIASRMTRLAKAACKIVKQQDFLLDASQLFQTSLEDYDVLFYLSTKAAKAIMRDAAAEAGAKKTSVFKNLDERTGKVPLPVRAHPVDILMEQLQRVYEDTLIFFCGGHDDDDSIIGAIWSPKLQKQKFRAGLPYNFSKVAKEEEDVVEVNRQAVLLEIARIGGEMIKKIEEVDEE